MRQFNPKTKSNIDFILKVLSVFEGFQYKGKKYLSYIQNPRGGDEFLIRDNLIKPLFTDVLGYDKQKDFAPEERIRTGRPDIQIIDSTGRTRIVIETLSSGATKQEFDKHKKRLFNYTDELGAPIGILTNGRTFEIWRNFGEGKSKERLVLLKFEEIYKKFVTKGIDSLDSSELERLLKLRWLKREVQPMNPESLYKEPELDISEKIHFDRFLEQLQELMDEVTSDVKSQFELCESKYCLLYTSPSPRD